MGTKYKIEKSEQLEEGKHTGTIKLTKIKRVERKSDGKEFFYFKIFIQPEGEDYEKECSVSAPKEGVIKEGSHLGKILAKFTDVNAGTEMDPEVILTGQKVTFLVKEDGEYTKIDWETIKPAKAK